MDKDVERQMMQEYLRNEIIEKNYDPVEFQSFLESLKPGGTLVRENSELNNYKKHIIIKVARILISGTIMK